MLGNDIVDLGDPDSQPESFRPRFDERVFTAEERIAISRDRAPLARRWAHWAAKEAAYKLVKQVDPTAIFSPGRCRAVFDVGAEPFGRSRERTGVAEFLEPGPAQRPNRVRLRSVETEDFVHVIALPMGRDFEAVECKVETLEAPDSDAGGAVRALAVDEIARSLGVAATRITIGRRRSLEPPAQSTTQWTRRSLSPQTAVIGPSGFPASHKSRIPSVELDGKTTTLSLSLSHHGRFIAYAMTPQREVVSLQSCTPVSHGSPESEVRSLDDFTRGPLV